MAGLTPKQELWPLDKPKPYPANPRQITDKAISKVARSIEEFGFQQPIVVDTQGVIIAGHTRLAAAKQLQLEQVPVIVADLPEAKARAYRLADNRTAQETSWLDDLLGEELTALQELDFDLDATGFDEAELRALMSDDEELERAEQTPDVPEEAVSRLGDLWCLDEHRVYCGDATNAGHVAQVLSERQPHLMVTDPPYGIGYEYGGHDDTDKAANDNLCQEAFALAPQSKVYTPGLMNLRRELNRYPQAKVAVWRKKFAAAGNGLGGASTWEPIIIESPLAKALRDDVLEVMTDRVELNGVSLRKQHTCPKPVALFKQLVAAFSRKGDAVYDPFLGSGTTLIAAEMEGRICLGLELHPPYVDVIVQRWQDFTGREATRIDGTPFNALQPQMAA